ncbi:MAG: hypothetical protein Q8K60_01230 [Parachlamydiaceae bacterium]|nr:hypothetical protein [Parachlamydiaceae bacterium]
MSNSMDFNQAFIGSLRHVRHTDDFVRVIKSQSLSGSPLQIFENEINKLIQSAASAPQKMMSQKFSVIDTRSYLGEIKGSIDTVLLFFNSDVGKNIFNNQKLAEVRLKLSTELELTGKQIENELRANDFDTSSFKGVQLRQMTEIAQKIQSDPKIMNDPLKIKEIQKKFIYLTHAAPEEITYLHKLIVVNSFSPHGIKLVAYTQLLLVLPKENRGMIFAQIIENNFLSSLESFKQFPSRFLNLPIANQKLLAHLMIEKAGEGAKIQSFLSLIINHFCKEKNLSQLLQELKEDPKFFDDLLKTLNSAIQPSHGQKLIERYFEDANLFKKCLNLSVENPYALEILWKEPSLRQQFENFTLSQYHHEMPLLISLISVGETPLVSNIFKLLEDTVEHKDRIFLNLLDLCKGGYIKEAEGLLEKFYQSSNLEEKEFIYQIILQGDSQVGGAIKNLLILYEKNPLDSLLKEFHLNGFTPMNLNLLLMATRGHQAIVADIIESLNQPSIENVKKRVLNEAINHGDIELASVLYKDTQQRVWSWVENCSFPLTAIQLRQLYTVHSDLSMFKEDSQEVLSNEIRKLIANEKQSERFFEKLTCIQLGLIDRPTLGLVINLNVQEVVSNRLMNEWKNAKNNPKEIENVIIKTILSYSGELNPKLIESLQKTSFYKSLIEQVDSERSAQIERVLNAFSINSEMTLRLSACQVPKKGSFMHQLMLRELNLPVQGQLKRRDMYQIIIHGLMTPTRQGKVGSCFATAYVREQERWTDGLKQILEDYISIINQGELKRTVGPLTRNFPMNRQILESDLFKGENYLNKVREFTVASMGVSVNNELKNRFLKEYRITGNLYQFIEKKLSSNPLKEQILENLKQISMNWAKQNIITNFSPLKTFPNTDSLGVWILADKKTGELIESVQSYKKVHESCLAHVVNDLREQFPEQSLEIKKIFSQININAVDCEKKENGFPWISSKGGGQTFVVSQRYEQRNVYHLSREKIFSHKQFIERISSFYHGFSNEVQRTASKDSLFALGCDNPEFSHAFSVTLKGFYDSENKIDQWMNDHSILHSKLLNTQIPNDLKKKLFQNLKQMMSSSHPLLFQDENIKNLMQLETMGQIWDNLKKIALINGCDLKEIQQMEEKINSVLFKNFNIWNTFGHPLILIDSNYQDNPKWAVGMSVGSSQFSIHRLSSEENFINIFPSHNLINHPFEFRHFIPIPNSFDLIR